jgi:hypothetical protein
LLISGVEGTLVRIKFLTLYDNLGAQGHDEGVNCFNAGVQCNHVEALHREILRIALVIPSAEGKEVKDSWKGKEFSLIGLACFVYASHFLVHGTGFDVRKNLED